MRPRIRHTSGVLLAVGIVAAFLVSIAPPASASCMLPPLRSSDAFVGTVIEVGADGRTATVRTSGGDTVTVIGGPGAASGANVATSVDRHYRTGATYEFHPLNGHDPYLDNACTATHLVSGDRAGASGPTGRHGVAPSPAEGNGTAATGPGSGPMVGLGVLAVAGLAVVGLLAAARRRAAPVGE